MPALQVFASYAQIINQKRIIRSARRLEQLRRSRASHELPDAEPISNDVEIQRREEDIEALRNELHFFAGLFPESRIVGSVGLLNNPSGRVTPSVYLRHGLERHPSLSPEFLFKLNLRVDYRCYISDPLDIARYSNELRMVASKALNQSRFLEAGDANFVLGTYYFDVCDYIRALVCYKNSHEIWLNNPRHYAGELCKAAAHVADTHHRLGEYDQAEEWRHRAISDVKRHIEQFGIGEWTADYAVNYFLYKMVNGYPPGFPLQPDSQPRSMSVEERYVTAFGSHGTELAEICAAIAAGDSVFAPLIHHTSAVRRAAWEPRRAIEELHSEFEHVRKWLLAHLRIFLSAVKIAMYVDETEGMQSCSEETLLYLIEGAKQCEDPLFSPYWYADCLLTAYALCIRYSSNPEQAEVLFPLLQQALAKIGRRDRLQIAYAARRKDQAFNPLWLLAE